MHSFLIQAVDTTTVTLRGQDSTPVTLPLSCFEQTPVVGKEIRLLAVPTTIDQALPHSLARSLLNELLTPSSS